MNTLSPSPAVERQVRCWCGNSHLEDFSPDYWRCADCQTLVLRAMRGEEISQVRDDEQDFYGKNYYLHHVQEDYGLPDLATRARADLPERGLHWLRTMLKFVPDAGARTLELGCGHGGFVAMQRWAGLDATGLELSPWLVRQARDWFDVPILEGRLEDQELAAASWDAIVLMDVLEHLPDPRRTLGRAVSLLRSANSFLLIQTPCYPAGRSYEALCAEDHPFLQQLKPVEHLYLFSELAVQRLCAQLGIGAVRFEPAIFGHYDLFAVASASPLRERALPARAEMLLAAPPPARAMLALLDMGELRDGLYVRLAALSAECDALRQVIERQSGEFSQLHAATAELWPRLDAAENARNLALAQRDDQQRQFAALETDYAARLTVIEDQGAEISRLHAEIDRQLNVAADVWPKLDLAVNERNLLAAQLADLHGHFERSEADRAARLKAIEKQGAEISRLQAQVGLLEHELADLRGHFERGEADRALRLQVIEKQGAETSRLHAEIHRLGPKLESTLNERNLRSAELADLRTHFESSEADRAGRLQVIENQGIEIGHLREQLAAAEAKRADLSTEMDAMQAAHAALRGEFQAARERHDLVQGHWTSRVLKKIRLGPF